jgi:DNA processing protein
MDFLIKKISAETYPVGLLEIPDTPEVLYTVGAELEPDGIYLAVVGSRTHTRYGAEVCDKLIRGLAGTNIYIVSGLALGIDSVAHRSAIKAGLRTIAMPGSGLSENVLYPATNLSLAKQILASGGTLVSEFEPEFKATKWSFPRRNRLMAGIAQATLVIEATDKSGTLITARLALDYNRDVLAVPGPITSENSLGSNLLIKQGATPITRSEDILEALGIIKNESPQETLPLDISDEEKQILEMIFEPCSRDELIASLDGPVHEINALLSAMEIKGLIKEEFGEVRRVY